MLMSMSLMMTMIRKNRTLEGQRIECLSLGRMSQPNHNAAHRNLLDALQKGWPMKWVTKTIFKYYEERQEIARLKEGVIPPIQSSHQGQFKGNLY